MMNEMPRARVMEDNTARSSKSLLQRVAGARTAFNLCETRCGWRNRAVVLAAACMTVLVVAVPILGSAQDTAPDETQTQQLIQRGERIYSTVCIACHQPDGKGIEGIYLPLAGNPAVTLEDPTYLINVLITGRGGMPRFDSTYDDEEIAAVATYVRQAWGNQGIAVAPEFVAQIRAQYEVQEAASPTPEGQIPVGIATPQAMPGIATPVGVEEATPVD